MLFGVQRWEKDAKRAREEEGEKHDTGMFGSIFVQYYGKLAVFVPKATHFCFTSNTLLNLLCTFAPQTYIIKVYEVRRAGRKRAQGRGVPAYH